MEEMEPTAQAPVVSAVPERPLTKLHQITVTTDDQVEQVNQLLADGWRLVSIGYRADATVYVLGQLEEKRRQRAGFGFMRAGEESK